MDNSSTTIVALVLNSMVRPLHLTALLPTSNTKTLEIPSTAMKDTMVNKAALNCNSLHTLISLNAEAIMYMHHLRDRHQEREGMEMMAS